MLVLTRRLGESLIIEDNINFIVEKINIAITKERLAKR